MPYQSRTRKKFYLNLHILIKQKIWKGEKFENHQLNLLNNFLKGFNSLAKILHFIV